MSSGSSKSPKQTPVLDECGTDLAQLAAAGKLDPVIGRQREVERVIQILGRRTKNNPILIGRTRVGKTALAGDWLSALSTVMCRRL